MRRLVMVLMVFLFSIGIIGIACSSSTSEPTEEGLEQRAQAFFDAWSEEKWLDQYRFFPAAFKEACAPAEYVDFSRDTMDEMRIVLGLDDDGTFDFRVVAVRVEGIEGRVAAEILYKGDVLVAASGFENPEDMLAWKFIDGEWFMSMDDPDEDCD